MTAHLDLTLSCFCGGDVETGQQVHEPHRGVLVLTCHACGRDLALELRLTWLGSGSVRPHDWGTFGSGERPDRVARSVERAGLVHSAGGP